MFHYELDRGWFIADSVGIVCATTAALLRWRPRSSGALVMPPMSGEWLREHEKESSKH